MHACVSPANQSCVQKLLLVEIYIYIYIYIFITHRSLSSPKLLLGIGTSKTILTYVFFSWGCVPSEFVLFLPGALLVFTVAYGSNYIISSSNQLSA